MHMHSKLVCFYYHTLIYGWAVYLHLGWLLSCSQILDKYIRQLHQLQTLYLSWPHQKSRHQEASIGEANVYEQMLDIYGSSEM